MKILAIEFSSDHRSVAVLDGERLLAAQTVTEGRDTAAVQLIESALGQAEVGRSEIECIAVGIGPGSYTGIRAAIALTQGWQLALGVKVQAVDSLEALARGEQAVGRRGEITLAVDAQRGSFTWPDLSWPTMASGMSSRRAWPSGRNTSRCSPPANPSSAPAWATNFPPPSMSAAWLRAAGISSRPPSLSQSISDKWTL